MIETGQQIRIARPVQEVFGFMDQPANQPEITPSLTHSETLDRLENGGKRVAYTYEMVGIPLEGQIEAVEYEPEAHIKWVMTGDLNGEIEWDFTEVDGHTEVTYTTRYEIPGGVLERVVAPVVERYNERELRTTLENLRDRLEHMDSN